VISSQLGQPNYDRRFDLNGSGAVDIIDVLSSAPFMMKSCRNL